MRVPPMLAVVFTAFCVGWADHSRATMTSAAETAPGLVFEFKRFQLENGLDVILHRDDDAPRVSVNLWYHVGSGQERPGQTGFAHLFEHLMFEGSAHVPEGAFDAWLEAVGGDNNGSTTEDRTQYWIDVPPHALPLALFLESDRMGYFLDAMNPARVDGQRDIVKNERRQSYENRPYGKAYLARPSLLWPPTHPYSWPVIGSMEDLSRATQDDVIAFYRSYYAPGNASLVIAGPIDYARTERWVKDWFGAFPQGKTPPALVWDVMPLTDSPSVYLEDDIQLPKLMLGFRTVPKYAPADASLDVLAMVLGEGKQSRLYRQLVYEQQIAQSVDVYHESQKYGGAFWIEVVARPEQSLRDVEDAINHTIKRLVQDGPREEELLRVQHQTELAFWEAIESVGGFGGRADWMNQYVFFSKEPDGFAHDLARTQAVSRRDVQQAAQRFLQAHRVRISVVPHGATHLTHPGATPLDPQTPPEREQGAAR